MAEHQLESLSNARPGTSRRDPQSSATRLPVNLVRVPSVKQRTDFSCGNAATLALLRYWRWDAYARIEETDLYLPLETTRARGTEPQPIAAFLNTVGAIASEYRQGDVTIEDLERAVDLRQPPIVDLQAWRDDDTPWRDTWNAGHYVILVGYDEERVFFMDPCTMTLESYAYMLRTELTERWHDLAGEHNARIERMAIFVRGSKPPRESDEPVSDSATKLG